MGITVQTRNDGAQLKRRRALVAGSVGNFIEWYEFGVYGFFATIIASNFFSADGSGDLESLIKTYASFALAFFFRPVGAALFGRLGDRIGRRPHLGDRSSADVGCDDPDRCAAHLRERRNSGTAALDGPSNSAGIVGRR